MNKYLRTCTKDMCRDLKIIINKNYTRNQFKL